MNGRERNRKIILEKETLYCFRERSPQKIILTCSLFSFFNWEMGERGDNMNGSWGLEGKSTKITTLGRGENEGDKRIYNNMR